MSTRTRHETITFENEFSLDGIEQMQAPGIYVVEIEEELIMDLSFPAYRRTATMIRLFRPGGGGYEAATIDPRDLEAALERDAVLTSNFYFARQTRDSRSATNASRAADPPSSGAFSSAFTQRFRKAAARLRLKNKGLRVRSHFEGRCN
jgi:hypothetical protein